MGLAPDGRFLGVGPAASGEVPPRGANLPVVCRSTRKAGKPPAGEIRNPERIGVPFSRTSRDAGEAPRRISPGHPRLTLIGDLRRAARPSPMTPAWSIAIALAVLRGGENAFGAAMVPDAPREMAAALLTAD